MRKCAIVLLSAIVLAVMCGAAWADIYAKPLLVHTRPCDHYTISYMTSDFRSQYGASSNTSFAMIDLGYVHNFNNANSGSITITPKGPYVVGYVDPKYAGSSTYDKSVDNSRYVLMELIRKKDVKSRETVLSQETFKLRKYSEKTAPNNFRLFSDDGDLVFFGFDDPASQASLKGADYSISFDNGETETGKLTYDGLSTEDQLKSAPVPYIELKQDASGSFRSLIWRGVSASDPGTALRYTGANDSAMGIFRMADYDSLSFEVMLKDGSALPGGFVFNERITAGAPLEGEIKLTDFYKGEHSHDHVPDTAVIPMSDIVCVRVSGYNKWLFFPAQQSSGNGEGSNNSGNNNNNGGNTSETPIPITPGVVSGTPSAGSNVSDVTCGASGQSTPAELINSFKSVIANSLRISRITFLNTLTITVSYDNIANVPIGATVTINIANFSYPNPKGRLYALAKNKSDGMWRRFAVTRGASGISFELPVHDYFSSSEITIADIEDEKGSGDFCSAGASVLTALAALALIRRRTR